MCYGDDVDDPNYENDDNVDIMRMVPLMMVMAMMIVIMILAMLPSVMIIITSIPIVIMIIGEY